MHTLDIFAATDLKEWDVGSDGRSRKFSWDPAAFAYRN